MIRLIIIVAVLVLVLSQTAFIILPHEQGIVLEFGRLKQMPREPGLYFKLPFIQVLHRFDKRILPADIPPGRFITNDKKYLIVDILSRWQIDDPLKFYSTVRDEEKAVAALNDIIAAHLRREVARHTFKDFIRTERENIMEKVTAATADAAARFGVKVVDVRLRRLDLPEEVQNSVFARMKAERERIAKRYRAEGEERAREIRAEADKEQKVMLAEAYKEAVALRGEGDARAATVYADAYGRNPEFFSFMRHLEVYEKSFDKGTTLILSPDSDFMRFIGSPRLQDNQAPSADKTRQPPGETGSRK